VSDVRPTLPLPHAYPFLLLDRVVDVRPGLSARAIKNLTPGDPLLDADGLLSPVLMVEVLAEAAGIALLGSRQESAAVLAGVERFHCGRRAHAGARLEVAVRVVKIFGALVKARGVVRVDGRIGAAGEVLLRLSGRR